MSRIRKKQIAWARAELEKLDYVRAWFEVADWDRVGARYERALGAMA